MAQIMKSFKQYISETLIVAGGGKRNGQVIMLAGGSGSGKSFAVTQFIDSNNYKILNPDDVLQLAVKLANQGKAFDELKGKDLTNPEDLEVAYDVVTKKKKLALRRREIFLQNQKPGRLPNIILDRTFSKKGQFKTWAHRLRTAGYKPENIHVIWVLTDLEIALAQNIRRGKAGERNVPAKIIIGSHQGAKEEMRDLMFKRLRGAAIDGDIFVIFGGVKNTIFYGTPEGELPSGDTPMVVKDFRYIKVKSSGKRFDTAGNIAKKMGFIFQDMRKKQSKTGREAYSSIEMRESDDVV